MFTLREFRHEDLEELYRIDQACFDPKLAYSKAELTHYMSRRYSFTLVAESEGKIAGFIVSETDKRGYGHIITIDVLAEYRRSGLGTQLMEAAEKRMRAAGASTVFLETAVDNVAALKFYKRHSYMVLKTIPRYYHNEGDALLLSKSLV